MIQAAALLLAFQLAGEVIVRSLGLSLPGPVLGMAGLVVAFALAPRLFDAAEATARSLLSHLSLLFVPAGVGIVGHLPRMGADGGPLALAIIVSTVLAVAVAGLTFVGVARLVGRAGQGAP